MADRTNGADEMIQVKKSDLETLTKRLELIEAEREDEKLLKETAVQRFARQRKLDLMPKKSEPVKLVDTQVDDSPMHKDSCPYCNSKKEHSILDLVPATGRFGCRNCGKMWFEEDLGKTYSLALERGGIRWDLAAKAI